MSMVTSHLVWLFRTRDIRQRAKEAGQSFDEFEESALWQSEGIDLEKRMRGFFSGTSTEATGASGQRGISNTYGTFVHPETVTPKTVPNATT